MSTAFYENRDEKFFIGEMTHYPFPRHVHEVAEVVVLFSGSVTMQIGEQTCRLTPGDVAVVFPLVPHSYEDLSEDIGGLVAIFSPDIISEYSGIFRTRIPRNAMIPSDQTDEDTRMAARRLMELSPDPESHLQTAYLHLLLAGVLHPLEYSQAYDFNELNLGYQIIHYVSQHAFEPITLKSASRALGISESHLSHFFSLKMKINFRRFINAIRIDRAKMMMRSPEATLTGLCDACGFTNIRTFRRAFLQETGQLPSEYLSNRYNRPLT